MNSSAACRRRPPAARAGCTLARPLCSLAIGPFTPPMGRLARLASAALVLAVHAAAFRIVTGRPDPPALAGAPIAAAAACLASICVCSQPSSSCCCLLMRPSRHVVQEEQQPTAAAKSHSQQQHWTAMVSVLAPRSRGMATARTFAALAAWRPTPTLRTHCPHCRRGVRIAQLAASRQPKAGRSAATRLPLYRVHRGAHILRCAPHKLACLHEPQEC